MMKIMTNHFIVLLSTDDTPTVKINVKRTFQVQAAHWPPYFNVLFLYFQRCTY